MEEKDIAEIKPIRPPKQLFNDIKGRIKAEKKAIFRKRVAVFGALASFSIGGFSFIFYLFTQSIFQSEFGYFLRLLVNDPADAFANWRDFSLSLVESFPLEQALISLVFLFVIVESFIFLKNSRRLYSPEFNESRV